MAEESNALPIRNNEAENRFETQVEGHLAEAQYRREGDRIIFTHTLVPDALSGRGIAGQLAQSALTTARDQGLTVVPLCPYIAGYIKRHPEFRPLVDPEHIQRVQ